MNDATTLEAADADNTKSEALPPEAAPAAPAKPKVLLAIGESIQIEQKHLDLLVPVERNLQQQLVNLGAARERALVEEQSLLATIADARKNFENTVRDTAADLGLSFDGDFLYNYSQEKRAFTRTK